MVYIGSTRKYDISLEKNNRTRGAITIVYESRIERKLNYNAINILFVGVGSGTDFTVILAGEIFFMWR